MADDTLPPAHMLIEPLALKRVSGLGADAAAVAALPLGSFLRCNRITGGALLGRVF